MDEDWTYVIVKLITGEQIMCILTNEDDDSIEVGYPILFETIQSDNGHELEMDIKSYPFCIYSDDNFYVFHKMNVLFVNPLKEVIIPQYEKLIDAFGMNRELDVSIDEVEKKSDINIKSTSFLIKGTDIIN